MKIIVVRQEPPVLMLRLAFRNLLSRPARSLLSLMGLTVAIVGMVGLFSVAEGIDATVHDAFGRVPGIAVLQRGAPIPLFSQVPLAWAKEAEQLPGVHAVSPEIWLRANIINGKSIVTPPRVILGTESATAARIREHLYRNAVYEGRFLDETDAGSSNAVISRQIAKEFEVGVGDSLAVNGRRLDIVGIYFCGSLLLDSTIIGDADVVRQMSLFDRNTVSSFYVEPTGDIPNEELIGLLEDLFRGRDLGNWTPSLIANAGADDDETTTESGAFTPSGNVIVDFFRKADRKAKGLDGPRLGALTFELMPEPQSEEVPLDIKTADDMAEKFGEFSSDLDIFLMIMTSIGLTIAVLSILNTMLMSVTERIIEFGILKANGWSQGDVMKLITAESATLGFAGGVLGCVLGWAMTLFVNWKWADHIQLLASPGLLAFSLVFATIMGVGGGLYPAIWATRMMPMDAIRRG